MMNALNILIYIASAALGACIASGVACAAMRMTSGKSWLKGRSACDSCEKELKWHQLIPIFSYLLHRGHCSHCKKRVHWGYLAIEVLAAISGAAIAYIAVQNNDVWFAIRGSVILIFALFTIVLDGYKKLVAINFTLTITALLFLIPSGIAWQHLLIGIVVGAMFFFIQYILTKGKGIGLGDVYLGAAMGAALGWPMIIPAIFSGYIIGAIHALYLLARKKAHAKTELSLGVYLMLGLLLIYLIQRYFIPLFL